MVKIVVAYDVNKGIGYKGKIPWKNSEEMKFFVSETVGHPVVMGRKTWDSLPFNQKPLKGRENLVVTSSPELIRGNYTIGGLGQIYVRNLQIAMKLCKDQDCSIIGGEKIYKQALNLSEVRRIVASEIQGEFKCDRFFPELDIYDWEWMGLTNKFDTFNVSEWWRQDGTSY